MQPNNRGPEDRPEDHPEDHPEDRPEVHHRPEVSPAHGPEDQGLCHKVDWQGLVALCLDRKGRVVPCLGLECREEQVELCPECREAHKERVL